MPAGALVCVLTDSAEGGAVFGWHRLPQGVQVYPKAAHGFGDTVNTVRSLAVGVVVAASYRITVVLPLLIPPAMRL